MSKDKVMVNRAPVLTLWAAVVAERLGFDREAALTMGRAVAGLNAQSKGRRLGIYDAPDREEGDGGRGERAERERVADEVELLGRRVPIVETPAGPRAAKDGKPENADSVTRYLEKKFGADLAAVREAFETLANALPPERLADRAYDLYESFRPEIPRGKRGWGAEGELDLEAIRRMADEVGD